MQYSSGNGLWGGGGGGGRARKIYKEDYGQYIKVLVWATVLRDINNLARICLACFLDKQFPENLLFGQAKFSMVISL